MKWDFSKGGTLPKALVHEAAEHFAGCPERYKSQTGWLDLQECGAFQKTIGEKAKHWQSIADTLVVVGIGGSNQAARGVLSALGTPKMNVLYAGNTLSAWELQKLLETLEGKSICLHVIAKNFETLEPGSHYRILRQYMETRYPTKEISKRVVLTGTTGTRLEEIAKERDYLFLPFPNRVGGRYSAFTNVGLLPIATAGHSIGEYLAGAEDMLSEIKKDNEHGVFQYAAWRNKQNEEGKLIEVLAAFEPRLDRLCHWWRQLFGESEGKDGKGIFPAYNIYSEDLHSMGQYMQQGVRCLMETFLTIENAGASVFVAPDQSARDAFDYLNGMDFQTINKAAEQATLMAHETGGVPCAQIVVKSLTPYHFGELYFAFMAACAASGGLLNVNPFDQNGVEAYKQSMFRALRK